MKLVAIGALIGASALSGIVALGFWLVWLFDERGLDSALSEIRGLS